MQARGFQIIQALRAMNLVDRLSDLQFDEDDVFDKQVNRIVPQQSSYRTTMGCCCETAIPDLRSSCTNAFS